LNELLQPRRMQQWAEIHVGYRYTQCCNGNEQ